jgi:hypothetical protein
MAEVKLSSKHLNSLKKFIEDALTERLQELQEGIKRTQERITFFENKELVIIKLKMDFSFDPPCPP